MNILELASFKPPNGGSPRFEGWNYGANVSFFVVMSATGKGADKHRHPYEEVFVILEGEIEVIVKGEMRRIGADHIVVIPANTWHEFKNRSSQNALMVNIHPVPQMIQEDWSET
jgi:mannose-6-phosphate isomerase-like protein (cupin superfamily)